MMSDSQPDRPTNCDSPESLTVWLKDRGRAHGLSLVGVTAATSPTGYARLEHWLDAGYAGEMGWIERRRDAYRNAGGILPSVRSLIVGAVNYRSEDPRPAGTTGGRVARYAWGQGDYHHWLKDRLRLLANDLHEARPGSRSRVVVDTAPLLERDFARLAGLGWFGKNTMLINKWQGSFLLLGAILTDAELAPDQPHETAHCGTCTRCLDACPTAAFPEPGVLDATKCLAYWNIETKGPIPEEIASRMGEWVFGCDICQDVCPWNRKSPRSTLPEVQPSPDLNPLDLAAFLEMSPEDFDRRFAGTPLERPGYEGMRRNAAIVMRQRASYSQAPPGNIGNEGSASS